MKDSLIGVFSMLIVSVSAAFTTKFALSSKILPVFISTNIAWFGYLVAHKKFTGELIHSTNEEISIEVDQNRKQVLGLIIGIIMCIAAFPICILGVHYSNIIYLILGYLTFFSGYMIAHQNWFGSPL